MDVENFQTAGNQGPMTLLTNGGHNILLSPGPPDALWKQQRELTIPINKDRFGQDSLVGNLFESSLKICTSLSEEMKDQHGKPLDLFRYMFHFMITANNVSIFGEEFGHKAFPGLTDDMYKGKSQTSLSHIYLNSGFGRRRRLNLASIPRLFQSGCRKTSCHFRILF